MIKKRAIAGVLCLGVMIFGAFLLRPEGSSSAGESEPSAAVAEDQPTSTTHDGEEIFQRAFWRRPGPDDRILHAERREWTDDEGVKKWQWFIKVHASARLITFLREENPFGMTRSVSPPVIPDPPSWFAPRYDDSETMVSRQSEMMMSFSRDGQHLFAADRGHGFRPGAPEARKFDAGGESAPDAAPRRLPDCLPPANQ